jgi:hypothetical protein
LWVWGGSGSGCEYLESLDGAQGWMYKVEIDTTRSVWQAFCPGELLSHPHPGAQPILARRLQPLGCCSPPQVRTASSLKERLTSFSLLLWNTLYNPHSLSHLFLWGRSLGTASPCSLFRVLPRCYEGVG